MKNTFNSRNTIAGSAIFAVLAFALAFGAFPGSAHAQFYTANQSGYAGSNCQYPTVYSNGYWTCSTPSVTTVTPVSYNYNYQNYGGYQQPQPTYQALSASCSPNNTSVSTGGSVQWIASPIGGNGTFSYSWSGTDGLSGSGQTMYMSYVSPGTKTATVTIYSGGQSYVATCNNFVTVYSLNNSTTYNNTYVTPYYQNNSYNYYPALAATCVVNTTYSNIGATVTWSASATGGNGYYSYSWSGTDAIYGQGQAVAYTYNTPGTKYASVTVYSNGQSITSPCSNYDTVGYTGGMYPIIGGGSSNAGLDVGCISDPTTADINQPITWNVEVTGGAAPYTYSWTGSDGLTGNQASVIKYYATRGSKSAIVMVTSADGKTGTRACSTTVNVRGATVVTPARPAQPVPVAPVQTNGQNLSASALFSLSNIPWGWVAVLIILVLFAAVMYLLFNKTKI